MKQIKVAIIQKGLEKDSIRGIGVHTRELIKELKKIKELDIKLTNKVFGNFDIYHFQKFNPSVINIPLFKKGKFVLTVHDLISLIYPKNYPLGIKGKIRFYINKMLVKRADSIITISQTSKKDICRLFKIKPEKIFVTHLAARKIFQKISDKGKLERISKKYNLPEKFVLYVGDVNYNKNLYLLAKATKEIKVPLVIVGKQAKEENFDKNHIENKPLVKLLDGFGNSKNVMRLGFVDDSDLVCIYNLATLYCQPSLYEGFGLPILESFATGVPVVASKIQTHVEICDDAVVYTDPKDYKDMAEKISKILGSETLRKDLIGKGYEKLKNYSWENNARETYRVYKNLINNEK